MVVHITIPDTRETETGEGRLKASQGKSEQDPSGKKNLKKKRTGCMTHVVEHLPNKYDAKKRKEREGLIDNR
jgi:hypothetical protein